MPIFNYLYDWIHVAEYCTSNDYFLKQNYYYTYCHRKYSDVVITQRIAGLRVFLKMDQTVLVYYAMFYINGEWPKMPSSQEPRD